MFSHWMKAIVACAMSALLLAGCSSVQHGPEYEGTYTAMVGPKVKLSSTSSYRLAAKTSEKNRLEKPYFIEFRARNALSYGHAFVVFGVRDKNGNVPLKDYNAKNGVLDPRYVEIAGLHPNSDRVSQFVVGHVVPVKASSGPSDGDFEEVYVLEKYRINLTEAEFKKVVQVIKHHKRMGVFWSGPLYACVHFVAAVARDLGLKNPPGLHLPPNYVSGLKRINGKNPKLKFSRRANPAT